MDQLYPQRKGVIHRLQVLMCSQTGGEIRNHCVQEPVLCNLAFKKKVYQQCHHMESLERL